MKALLDLAVEEAEKGEAHLLEAECRRLRGTVGEWLNDSVAASSDLSRAVELYPCSRTRLAYAQYLIGRGSWDDALTQLDRHQGSLDLDAVALLRAITLWNRNLGKDRELAEREFVRLTSTNNPINALEALTHGVHALLVGCRPAEAVALLQGWQDDSRTYVLWARVSLAAGERAKAIEYAEKALATLSQQPYGLRRWLAIVFTSVKRRTDALSVWLATVPEHVLDNDAREMFELAADQRVDHVVMSRAAALRAAGIYDDEVISLELSVRERYDRAHALVVANEAVEHRPDDKLLAVQRAWLAYRAGNKQLSRLDAQQLPKAGEVPPQIARVIIRLLVDAGEGKIALEYAYAVYRSRPRDADALRCLRDVFFEARDSLELAQTSAVSTESAVRVVEKDGAERWLFIEPDGADPTRGEIAPDSQLGKQLLGSAVGAQVVLSASNSDRTARVLEITSKYVRRIQQVFNEFEILVPDSPELSVMHVGDGNGGVDPAPMVEMLKAARENAAQAVAAYKDQPIASLRVLARMLGRTELEAIVELSRAQVPVRCARATSEEQTVAAVTIAAAREVVVDLTALLTLFLTQTSEFLRMWPVTFVTSQGTMDALHGILRTDAPSGDDGQLFADLDDGQLVFRKLTPTQVQERVAAAESFLAFIEERVTVVACSHLASWDPSMRELLSKFYGWHGAEVIDLSVEPGRVLWCDDFSLAEIASREHHALRVWTQAVAAHLEREAALTIEKYDLLSARLLAMGYDFTSLNLRVLKVCGDLADWNRGRSPIREVIAYISKPELNGASAAALAAHFVALLRGKMALPMSRDSCQVEVQEALFKRTDHKATLSIYTRTLFHVLRLDPIGCADAKNTFLDWVRARRLAFT